MKNSKKLLALLINFIVLEGLYQLALYLESKFYPFIPFTIYAFFLIECILIVIYMIFSYGGANSTLTPDMLPSHLTASQKNERIEKIKERKIKSKNLLFIIIPLALVVGLAFIYDFVIMPSYLAKL